MVNGGKGVRRVYPDPSHHNADNITKKLQRANVEVRVAPYWMRIAPSVYNDIHDIDRVLEALSWHGFQPAGHHHRSGADPHGRP